MANPNVRAAFSLGDIVNTVEGSADPSTYVPGGNSNNSGPISANPGNAFPGTTAGSIINDIANPGANLQNGISGGSGGPGTASPAPVDPNAADEAALQGLLTKNQQAATSLSNYANDFGTAMPGYLDAENSNLKGQARSALTNDIYNVNADANSRGLLNSGIRAGNQANAAGLESSKLASGIQKANSTAYGQLDQAKQNAANAQSIVDGENTAFGSLQQTASADQYNTAIQELGNQNQYLGGLIGGLSKGAGAAAAALFA